LDLAENSGLGSVDAAQASELPRLFLNGTE